jgi:alkane 1-monooxygenase
MTAPISSFRRAAPFWLSLGLVPLAWIGAVYGGWTVFLLPLVAWWVFTGLDAALGLNLNNPDTSTEDSQLLWYRLITMIWFPVQALTVFGLLYYVTRTGHLLIWEKIALFFGVGVLSGTIGIVYSHELLHQKNKLERWLGDLLLATVLYSHFRSEHLLVHHIHVGTPRDAVTARYNENFHRFFIRVLFECPRSAWGAEKAMLARKGLTMASLRNPFWRYAILQLVALAVAFAVGGFEGLGLFLIQAISAIWQLEMTNYVEHYGLVRKYLGNGKYEHVKPHHSWNASHKATNWLLINLQRHSDHHYKPDRRFPLLQTYDADEAPQLPFGYPLMAMMAMIPPLWLRRMNPRVRAWRKQYYPEITDWAPYKEMRHSN